MSVVNEPACYLLIRKGDKLLFVMREHTGFMDGHYSLPAGHVELDESYSTGAVREVFEEVGLKVSKDTIRHVFTQHRHTPTGSHPYWTDVFFEATEWSGEPVNNEPDKHSGLEWISIHDLPENVMGYQRYALLQIAEGKSYGEYGWEN